MIKFTYEPNNYKTLPSGRTVLLAPGDPLPPPFIGVASTAKPPRSPCRINGYGGTMFEPPADSYEWATILAHLNTLGHRSAKCDSPVVAEQLVRSGFEAIRHAS